METVLIVSGIVVNAIVSVGLGYYGAKAVVEKDSRSAKIAGVCAVVVVSITTFIILY